MGAVLFSGRVARPFHAQALYIPLAVIGTASLALQPSLGKLAQVAREEIAAGGSTLGIRQGERRDVAAGAGVWVLPADTVILVAPSEAAATARAYARSTSEGFSSCLAAASMVLLAASELSW